VHHLLDNNTNANGGNVIGIVIAVVLLFVAQMCVIMSHDTATTLVALIPLALAAMVMLAATRKSP